MSKVDAEIPEALFNELSKYLGQHPSQELDRVVSQALKMYLEGKEDNLFQVSTASALVAGIYGGAISAGALLEHGDLGLGTFENLDGEMIVVAGEVFQARFDGSVQRVSADQKTPFAVVTQFTPSERLTNVDCLNIQDLERKFDQLRDSDNLYYALRATGVFDKLYLRAVCKTEEGVPLVQAAAVQAEFSLEKMEGSLVGFWSPGFARALSVPGYHLHFLSKEKHKGGHLLNLSGENLCLELQRKTGFTTMLPQNHGFLSADLTHDPSADLDKAERIQKR